MMFYLKYVKILASSSWKMEDYINKGYFNVEFQVKSINFP